MIARLLMSLIDYLRTPAARTANDFGNAIEEEIAFHISERTREYIAQGMSEEDARRTAQAKFGDASQVAVQCHAAAIGVPVLWHRLHLTLTAALTVSLGIFWLNSASRVGSSQMPASQLPTAIASMLDNDWTGDIIGRVVDERGRPIDQARVLVVVKTWPDQSYFQRAYQAVTDAQGRFKISDVYPVNERYEVQITAVANDRALVSSYREDCVGVLEPLSLQLPPSSGLEVQVESEQGTTVTGAEILPSGRIEASGTRHFVYFDSARPLFRRTDADGRVQLPYFQPGDTASVMIRTNAGDWQRREILVPETGNVVTIRVSQKAEVSSQES